MNGRLSLLFTRNPTGQRIENVWLKLISVISWFYWDENMAFYIGGLDTMTNNWRPICKSHWRTVWVRLAQLDLVGESICELHPKNRTQIGHFLWILGPFSKFDEKWDFWTSMRKYAWVWDEDVIDKAPNVPTLLKIQTKNAPKSIKNVRFGSGFLDVIRKLIPQQDPNVPIALKPSVSEK